MKQKSIVSFISLWFCFFTATNSYAISDFTAGDLSDLSQNLVDELVSLVGVQAAHRPYRPASSLGLVVGLEFGVDAVALSTSDEFVNALQAATDGDSAPSVIPVPRFSIHKGLPAGFEFGFSYLPAGETGKILGFDLKYTLPIPGFSLAGRINYTIAELWFFETKTWAFDVLASVKLPIIEPYLGLSLLTASGGLTSAAAASLPGGVDGSPGITKTALFIGLPIKLLILKIVPEYSMILGGEWSAGAKVAISI